MQQQIMCSYIHNDSIVSETCMFTEVFKDNITPFCFGNIGNVFLGYKCTKNIYQTPTTTNARLPAEQQNGYHRFGTEQFTEGANEKLNTGFVSDDSAI